MFIAWLIYSSSIHIHDLVFLSSRQLSISCSFFSFFSLFFNLLSDPLFQHSNISYPLIFVSWFTYSFRTSIIPSFLHFCLTLCFLSLLSFFSPFHSFHFRLLCLSFLLLFLLLLSSLPPLHHPSTLLDFLSAISFLHLSSVSPLLNVVFLCQTLFWSS